MAIAEMIAGSGSTRVRVGTVRPMMVKHKR
jgi:hypothetical protein